MSGELGKVVVVVGGDTGGLDKAIEEIKKALGETEKATGKFSDGFSGMWKQMALGQVAADALRKGVSLLTGVVKDSFKGALEAEQSENRLKIALDSTGRSTKAMLPGLIAYSKQLMAQTTFTDEAAQEAMTLLSQLTKLDTNGIKAATRGAMGLATVMRTDLNSATLLVSKAMEGNTTVLKRAGIEIDKNLKGADLQAEILKKLNVLYQQSTGETQTFGGQMKQLGNMVDEVKESFGGALVNNETFKKLMVDIKDKIIDLIESGKIAEWADAAAKAIKGVASVAETLLGWIDKIVNEKNSIPIGKQARESQKFVNDLCDSLKVIKPNYHDLLIEVLNSDEPWANIAKRYRDADKALLDNKDTIAGWVDKAAKFLGLAQELPGPINETGNAAGGAAEKLKSLKDELGLTFKSDIAARIKQIEKALSDYKKQLSPESEKKLREELATLKAQLTTVGTTVQNDVNPPLSDLEKQMFALVQPTDDYDATLKNVNDTLDIIAANAAKAAEPHIKATAEIGNAWAEVCLQLAKDISGAFAGMISGTTSFADGMKSIFSGLAASVGQAIGTTVSAALTSLGAMAGPVGSLVGGVIGGVLSVFGTLFESSETYAEQAQKAFADAINGIVNSLNYLGEVSGSTAEMLQSTATEFMNQWGVLADSMGGQGMADALALSLHLNDVMRDTGVNVYNLANYWTLANTALGQYSMRLLTAEQASGVLDDAFSSLRQAVEDMGQSGSAAMRDFILSAREAGLEIGSVTSYINDQLGLTPKAAMSAAQGLAAMASGVAPGLADLVEKQKELKEQLAQTEVGSDEWVTLTNAIAANQAQIDAWAASSGDDLSRIAGLTLTTFNAMIANGASAADAMNSIGPTLDILAEKYADLGIEAPASIAQLLKIRGVQEAHEELFSAIDGNKAVLEALANTGYLTAEALTDVAGQAGDYYEQLKAAGLTSQEALATMAPTLQSIHDYAEENGIVLDENTQSLIDQAEAAGLVEDAETSTADAMLAVGAVIAKAFGQDIPEAMQEALDKMNGVGGSVEDAADAVTDDLGGAFIGITDGPVADLGDAAKKIGQEFKDTAIDTGDEWGKAIIGINDGPIAELIGNAKEARDAWIDAAKKAKKEWDGMGDGGNGNGNGGGGGGGHAYASGGIAWRPQLATVAERGPEVIIPMTDYQSGTGLAAGIGMGAGATSTNHISVTINAQTLDDRTIQQAGEKIYREIERQQKRRG